MLAQMSDAEKAAYMASLSDEEKARLMAAMDPAARAAYMNSLSEEEKARLLDAMSDEERATLRGQLKELSTRVKSLDGDLKALEEQLEHAALCLPNLPSAETPDGASEEDNKVVRTWGEPPTLDFEPADHASLGEALGILDFEAAARVSGARREESIAERRRTGTGGGVRGVFARKRFATRREISTRRRFTRRGRRRRGRRTMARRRRPVVPETRLVVFSGS